jgi:alpha-L-fucosidase
MVRRVCDSSPEADQDAGRAPAWLKAGHLHESVTAKVGPKRDLDAARFVGLKAGLYFSLMDGVHPDAARFALDKAAYRRYIAFVHESVRELVANYGTLDVL